MEEQREKEKDEKDDRPRMKRIMPDLKKKKAESLHIESHLRSSFLP